MSIGVAGPGILADGRPYIRAVREASNRGIIGDADKNEGRLSRG